MKPPSSILNIQLPQNRHGFLSIKIFTSPSLAVNVLISPI